MNFDKALIITTETLCYACYLGLFLLFFNWTFSYVYHWAILALITFTLGFWKDYRNAEFQAESDRSRQCAKFSNQKSQILNFKP